MTNNDKEQKEAAKGDRMTAGMPECFRNPQFIFDVLTSIYYLCETDAKKTQQAVYDLLAYLRSSLLCSSAGESVALALEMEQVRSYLSLQQMRFGGQWTVRWEDNRKVRVPPFSVMQFVSLILEDGLKRCEDDATVLVNVEMPAQSSIVRVSCAGEGLRKAERLIPCVFPVLDNPK